MPRTDGKYISDIHLVLDSPLAKVYEVTAYAYLEDGWHTKTFQGKRADLVVAEMVEAFCEASADSPEHWPLGSPYDTLPE